MTLGDEKDPENRSANASSVFVVVPCGLQLEPRTKVPPKLWRTHLCWSQYVSIAVHQVGSYYDGTLMVTDTRTAGQDHLHGRPPYEVIRCAWRFVGAQTRIFRAPNNIRTPRDIHEMITTALTLTSTCEDSIIWKN